MPSPFRSPRHLFVLVACVGLLFFGLWQGISHQRIQGENGSGFELGLQLSPWMLIGWLAGVLLLFFAWRRRA